MTADLEGCCSLNESCRSWHWQLLQSREWSSTLVKHTSCFVLYRSALMDYKASRCGVADASLHHAKWGHIVAPLGVVQRCISSNRGKEKILYFLIPPCAFKWGEDMISLNSYPHLQLNAQWLRRATGKDTRKNWIRCWLKSSSCHHSLAVVIGLAVMIGLEARQARFLPTPPIQSSQSALPWKVPDALLADGHLVLQHPHVQIAVAGNAAPEWRCHEGFFVWRTFGWWPSWWYHPV